MKAFLATKILLLVLTFSLGSISLVSAHTVTISGTDNCPVGHVEDPPFSNVCSHPQDSPGVPGGQVNEAVGVIETPDGFSLDPSNLLNQLVSLILGIAGLIFFFLLLYGGIRYMLAGGDPKNAESARKILTAAFIGLLIVVGAYFITTVLGELLGIDFLSPNIPGLD
jgi:amino acid transporter